MAEDQVYLVQFFCRFRFFKDWTIDRLRCRALRRTSWLRFREDSATLSWHQPKTRQSLYLHGASSMPSTARQGAAGARKNIEAFRKEGIAKPTPFEAPVYADDDREYVVDLSGFDVVNDPRDAGGRIALPGDARGKGIRRQREGEKVGGEFDEASDPQVIGDRFAFRARRRDKTFIIEADGERVGGKYDAVGLPRSIGGRIAFRAQLGDNCFIVSEDGSRRAVNTIA